MLAIGSGGSAFAEESPAPPARIQRYLKADGLPSNAIQTTLTDAQGFLWVATGQGLARFDGHRWRVFDSRNTPALVSSEIRNLHLLRNGRMLVALASGSILLRAGDNFESLATLDVAANQFHETADGTLMVAGVKLLGLAAGQAPRTLLDNAASGGLIQFAAHGDRRFVLFPRIGLIREMREDGSTHEWPLGSVGAEDLLTVWEDDLLWIVGAQSRWRLDMRRGQLDRFEQRLDFKPRVSAKGPDGWIWIGGRGDAGALCRIRSLESAVACETVSIDARNITAMAFDEHGALWVSSWDTGLFRITTPPIAHFGDGRMQSLLPLSDGSVVAQGRDGAIRMVGDRVRPLTWPPSTSPGDYVLSLAQLPDGRVVRGRRHGLDLGTPPEFSDWAPLPPTLEAAPAAYALYVDRQGALWTGNERASYFLDGHWSTLPEPMALQYAYTESPSGTLWAATSGGIYRKDVGQGFRLADAPKPRTRLIAMSALTDSRGHVWFGGYESGLYRHDGHAWLHLDTTRGLPDDTAYGLVEDQQQRLWISHGRGLYTLSLAEADRMAADPQAQAQVREYSSADGLPADGFNGGSGLAAIRDQAGMLWFASDYGAVRLDPARLPVAIDPPQAVLLEFGVDGHPQPMTDAISLAAGTQELAVGIAVPAPGFAERVAMRFRLEPLQQDWTQAAAGQPLSFQRLPPGSYQLRVEVGVDGEQWRPSLNVAIAQQPYWWQRPIAWLIAGLVTVLLALGLVRWRMGQLRERNRRLESLVAQRGDELAGERVALAEAQAAQAEAEQQLRWLQRHRALEEWAEVDAIARSVFAVLIHCARPATAQEILAQLQIASAQADRQWTLAEVDAALDRLRARAAVCVDQDHRWTTVKPDWTLLPDLELPLTELIHRAAPRIGAYRVLERIGEGAMGEVFRAVSVHDGTEAALKLVHRDASANPETRQRLEREGEIVSSLSHPNIVRLLERGEHDGRLYLAMEFLKGTTLHDRLSAVPALSRIESLQILGDIAAALAALHQRGVIHRDLHPGNVMILADGSARLLDFGLARAASHGTLTRANTLLESLPYLAPEVIAGRPASPASDLFALGVLAIECLGGQRPWHGVQTLELVVEIARYTGPDTHLLDGIETTLQPLVRQLLDQSPESRGSASAALIQFRPCLTLPDETKGAVANRP